MINIVLFIIGILCVITTFFLFIKDSNNESEVYNEIVKKHREVEEYVNVIEDITSNLEKLINNALYFNENQESILKMEKRIKELNKKEEFNIEKENMEILDILNNNENTETKENIKEEILKLNKMGLDSHEIAKRLNRGKREVDIIIKMKDGRN